MKIRLKVDDNWLGRKAAAGSVVEYPNSPRTRMLIAQGLAERAEIERAVVGGVEIPEGERAAKVNAERGTRNVELTAGTEGPKGPQGRKGPKERQGRKGGKRA